MSIEDEHYTYFTALRFGEVLVSGPTPVPDDIREQATEIHWYNSDPTKDSGENPPEDNLS